MPVENLARSDVVTASKDESIENLASMMDDHSVGSVVIADDDEPVGIVTDRDLTIEVVAAGKSADSVTAADVMSSDLCTIESDEGFYRATELMSEHGIRRLPVVDTSGQLEGIITVDDLNELLADEHQQLASVVQAQRPPY
ncbi:CBS domain-containing protein [Natrarchaeobaculum sulfurireducens]|uniref:CBS domain n=1 Tax=Natrarchaeobaculum sulfurireducens TaxID=2044521 RepID=A0A346PPI7_9EURY|nr:CBS domain-containing protein [Natrarchaeobaculum sulfurireducens]AXR78514.1 CBS domain [Natrarchaeobaculum sulfurireducens]AXR81432.1 CBS domain protein [Natrarchaeobaculum sulfurireducens]